MKSKELIKILEKHPDFDVDFIINDLDGSDWGFNSRHFEIIGLCDVGYSSQILRLEVEEDN